MSVDVERAADVVDIALGMKLGTSRRVDIVHRADVVIEVLGSLLAGIEREGVSPDVKEHVRVCDNLLDLKVRPSEATPAHEAFAFLLHSAEQTRLMLTLYRQQYGSDLDSMESR